MNTRKDAFFLNLSKYRISLGQFLSCTNYNSCRLLNEHKFVHILRQDTKAILWNVSRKNIGWSAKQCRMAYCKFEKLHFIVKQKQKLRLSYLANISSHHIEANLLLHRMHDIVHIFLYRFIVLNIVKNMLRFSFFSAFLTIFIVPKRPSSYNMPAGVISVSSPM